MDNQYRPTTFRLLPPVIKNLLIINGLFFLATFSIGSSMGIDLRSILGLHLPLATEFEPYQFITYMFMHADFWHLFFNMFALWMFGKILEEIWGAKRFLIYYLITGIGASLIHYGIVYYELLPTLNAVQSILNDPSTQEISGFIQSSNFKVASYDIQTHLAEFTPAYNAAISKNPTEALQLGVDFLTQYRIDLLNSPLVVGASGAVFGLLLAFGMTFPNTLIYVYFAIPIKAKWFVMIYGAFELYSGMNGNQSNVAHFAHLGGMLFGFILLMYWKKTAKHNRFL